LPRKDQSGKKRSNSGSDKKFLIPKAPTNKEIDQTMGGGGKGESGGGPKKKGGTLGTCLSSNLSLIILEDRPFTIYTFTVAGTVHRCPTKRKE